MAIKSKQGWQDNIDNKKKDERIKRRKQRKRQRRRKGMWEDSTGREMQEAEEERNERKGDRWEEE